jgi:hypothetical protein
MLRGDELAWLSQGLLDYPIEEKQGSPVPKDELERIKAWLLRELRRIALR